jgi:hypothetical protein
MSNEKSLGTAHLRMSTTAPQETGSVQVAPIEGSFNSPAAR